jgi:hypothetical protein
VTFQNIEGAFFFDFLYEFSQIFEFKKRTEKNRKIKDLKNLYAFLCLKNPHENHVGQESMSD